MDLYIREQLYHPKELIIIGSVFPLKYKRNSTMARNKWERDAELAADAERIERERQLKFALNAIWGSVEKDKNWQKKNAYIASMVEKVLKEGE
jgi:hypothetical protein